MRELVGGITQAVFGAIHGCVVSEAAPVRFVRDPQIVSRTWIRNIFTRFGSNQTSGSVISRFATKNLHSVYSLLRQIKTLHRLGRHKALLLARAIAVSAQCHKYAKRESDRQPRLYVHSALEVDDQVFEIV